MASRISATRRAFYFFMVSLEIITATVTSSVRVFQFNISMSLLMTRVHMPILCKVPSTKQWLVENLNRMPGMPRLTTRWWVQPMKKLERRVREGRCGNETRRRQWG